MTILKTQKKVLAFFFQVISDIHWLIYFKLITQEKCDLKINNKRDVIYI